MEVDGVLLTLLGTAAGILILTGWVEQIYKGYKTKSLKDVSKFLMIFFIVGSSPFFLPSPDAERTLAFKKARASFVSLASPLLATGAPMHRSSFLPVAFR